MQQHSFIILSNQSVNMGGYLQQQQAYKVDLTKINGEGEFPCPKCRTIISPDDTNEDNYHIIEPKVNNHGLSEIVLSCNQCGSEIYLTGFALLEKLKIP